MQAPAGVVGVPFRLQTWVLVVASIAGAWFGFNIASIGMFESRSLGAPVALAFIGLGLFGLLGLTLPLYLYRVTARLDALKIGRLVIPWERIDHIEAKRINRRTRIPRRLVVHWRRGARGRHVRTVLYGHLEGWPLLVKALLGGTGAAASLAPPPPPSFATALPSKRLTPQRGPGGHERRP